MNTLRLWIRFVGLCVRLWTSPLWRLADKAVKTVAASRELQAAAAVEPVIAYCPRCGQCPDGDRRMEEARHIVHELLKGTQPNRAELDFALAWAYWKHKKLR